MIDQVRKLMAPMHRRLAMMVGRVLLTLIEDGAGVQVVQVEGLADETLDGVERFQNYGLTSVPHPGADAIMVAVAGTRSQGVVVVVDDRRYRLRSLQPGEVALYDDLGQVVHLTRDGIEITTTTKVTVTAPQVEVVADTVVVTSGDIQLGGPGGKKVALHDDPIVAGKIVASSTKVTAS